MFEKSVIHLLECFNCDNSVEWEEAEEGEEEGKDYIFGDLLDERPVVQCGECGKKEFIHYQDDVSEEWVSYSAEIWVLKPQEERSGGDPFY